MIDNDKLNSLIMAKETIDSSLKTFMAALTDKSIPLDDRWNAFKILCSKDILTDIESYGDGNVSILEFDRGKRSEVELYDDFYYERHQTVDYVDMAERIEEGFGYGDNERGITPESFAEWKEAALKSKHRGFVFDW